MFDSLTPSHSRFVQRRGRLALTQVTLVRVQHREPFLRGYRSIGKDRTLRTFRLGFESSYPYHRLVAQWDRAYPSEGYDLSSNLSGPATRWWPNAKAPDCRSGPRGFNSLSSRQITRGVTRLGQKAAPHAVQMGSIPIRLTTGPNSTGEQRVVFQATIGRFDSGWPYQVAGPKLCRRSTRLLSGKAEFDSPRTHHSGLAQW